jgi:hypothetical protein
LKRERLEGEGLERGDIGEGGCERLFLFILFL